jgi:hypothetical protein
MLSGLPSSNTISGSGRRPSSSIAALFGRRVFLTPEIGSSWPRMRRSSIAPLRFSRPMPTRCPLLAEAVRRAGSTVAGRGSATGSAVPARSLGRYKMIMRPSRALAHFFGMLVEPALHASRTCSLLPARDIGGVDRGPTSSSSNRFAMDSPLEGSGFEPSVPLARLSLDFSGRIKAEIDQDAVLWG